MAKLILPAMLAMGVMTVQAAPYSSYPQNTPSQNQNYNQSSSIPAYNPNAGESSYYNQGQGQGQNYYNNQYRDTSGYTPGSNQPQPGQYTNPNSNQPQNRQYSNSYMNQPQAYNDESTNTRTTTTTRESKYPQDQAFNDTDRRLNDKIREKITGWFTDKYKNVGLNTTNGNVTIVGFVNSDDDLKKLIVEIRKVDGVRNVNSNVNVSDRSDNARSDNSYDQSQNQSQSASDNKYPQDRATTEADRRINDKIRNKISGWFTDSYKNIVLSTSNGNVVITGYVSKADDLNKLQNEVRKIDGVRNVTNNAQVKE